MIKDWVKADDGDASAPLQLLRLMPRRHEGTLLGGSSGSALAGALAWLRSESGREIAHTPLSPGKNHDVVILLLLPGGCV